MILNKYSINRLFKVTYLDGSVEMICARGILDFITDESQYDIQSIEVIAVAKFSKDCLRKEGIESKIKNYPSLIEYIEEK